MKTISRDRAIRCSLLLCLCALTLWSVKRQFQSTAEHDPMQTLQALRDLPDVDTQGGILGNPQNAVDDMKSVYKSVSIFRRKHNRYPRSSMELLNDMAPNPGAYEFADRDAAVASLSNPDIIHQHPRWSKERIKNMTTYQMRFRRFDSSPFGSQKPEGTRDVLMWSSDYYFENIKNNYDNINASTMNPVGFYLVLWDDGQIERVPFDKTLQVPAESNSWQVGFAGQAGLTKGSKTFDEFHKNLINYRNWKRAQGKKSQ